LTQAQGVLELLRMMSLEGCIVTGDALHCHRSFAATLLTRRNDAALACEPAVWNWAAP